MRIHFNAFWGGFMDGTDCNNIGTMLRLFEMATGEQCTAGGFDESEALCESVFGEPVVGRKTWKWSALFSGESRLNGKQDQYSVVLWGQRTSGRTVEFPLYTAYAEYKRERLQRLLETGGASSRTDVAPNHVLAMISNGGAPFRNEALDALERAGLKITYAGPYRNNIGYVAGSWPYYSDEQIRFMSLFKFVLAFENSRDGSYITEKIMNPLFARVVPVYYGSVQVEEHFNAGRFINLASTGSADVAAVVAKIGALSADQDAWLEMVNRPVFNQRRSLEAVAADVKVVLGGGGGVAVPVSAQALPVPVTPEPDAPVAPPVGPVDTSVFAGLTQIYCIVAEEREPARYARLGEMFARHGRADYKCVCPSWKTTVTDKDMITYVKSPTYIFRYRKGLMKKAEISLFLNNIAVLRDIVANYTGGLFLVLESDTIEGAQFSALPRLMRLLQDNIDRWDVLYAGSYKKIYERQVHEDFTTLNSEIRVLRGTEWNVADAYIWKYSTVVRYLAYIDTHLDFKVPYDHYLEEFYINCPDVRACWVHQPEIFIQSSVRGMDKSTIQDDTE